jgi:hypothetical protein
MELIDNNIKNISLLQLKGVEIFPLFFSPTITQVFQDDFAIF